MENCKTAIIIRYNYNNQFSDYCKLFQRAPSIIIYKNKNKSLVGYCSGMIFEFLAKLFDYMIDS